MHMDSLVPKGRGIAECLLLSRGPCSVTAEAQYVSVFGLLTSTICFVSVNLFTDIFGCSGYG